MYDLLQGYMKLKQENERLQGLIVAQDPQGKNDALIGMVGGVG